MRHYPNAHGWGCSWRRVWLWQVPYFYTRGWTVSTSNTSLLRPKMALLG
jgi:hypothetical protein